MGNILQSTRDMFFGGSELELQGQVVLVTGASSGIGREVASQMHSRAMRVILAARSTEKLELLRTEPRYENCQKCSSVCLEFVLGPIHENPSPSPNTCFFKTLSLICLHHLVFSEIISLMLEGQRLLNRKSYTLIWKIWNLWSQKLEKRCLCLDKLILSFTMPGWAWGENGAGPHPPHCVCRGGALETEISVYSRLMTVNYLGCVELSSYLVPHMVSRGSGHVLVISSVQGLLPIPGRAAYCSSKHALQSWADCLRAELPRDTVKVSVISPGYVNTDLSRNALTASGNIRFSPAIWWWCCCRRTLRCTGLQPADRILSPLRSSERYKLSPQWGSSSHPSPPLREASCTA